MRRNRLCPGPADCASAQMEQPEVLEAECGPCEECPLEKLNAYIQSPYGRAIQSVVDLDFALERHITITLRDISYLEFLMLRVLGEEKQRWENDQAEKRR